MNSSIEAYSIVLNEFDDNHNNNNHNHNDRSESSDRDRIEFNKHTGQTSLSSSPSSSSSSGSKKTKPESIEPIILVWKNLRYEFDQYCWSKNFLRFHSKHRIILNRLNGFIRQNTLNGLLGPSGAGKTSLIRCLTGNVPDEHLSIDTEIYLDRNLYDRKDRISLVSFVPQSLNEIVYEQFNVIDILRYAFRFKNPFAKHHEADRFIEEIAKKLLLDSRIFYQKFSKCSGGEQRRIVIAQELMSMESNPPFLIVDEPTSGLDSEAALLLMQCLSLLTRNKSMTIIVSIHQPSSEIVELFDHLYVIGKGGVCLFTGPPKNLRSHLKIVLDLELDEDKSPIEEYLRIACEEINQNQSKKLSTDVLVRQNRNDFDQIAFHLDRKFQSIPKGMPIYSKPFNLYDLLIEIHRLFRLIFFLDFRNFFFINFNIICFIILIYLMVNSDMVKPSGCQKLPQFLNETFSITNRSVQKCQESLRETMLFRTYTSFQLLLLHLKAGNAIGNSALYIINVIRIFRNEHRNGWYSVGAFFWSTQIIFLLAMALNAIVFTLTTYFVVQIPIDHYEINCFRIVNLFFFTLLIIIYFQSFGILCGTLFSSNAEIAVVVANFILNNLTIVNGLLITLEIMKKPFLVQISNYLGYRYLTDGLLYAFYGIDRCDPQTEHSIMLKRLFIDDSNIYWNIRPAIIIIIIVRLEIYLVTFMKTNSSIVSKLCYRKKNRLKKIQAEIQPIDYSVTRSGDQSVEKNTLDADNNTPSFKEDKSKKCFEPNNRLLIAWRNLNLFASDSIYETRDLPQKSHHQFDSKQLILSDQNGHLRFGTLNALMGTSGAGKTSLLKTLNGQMKIRLASSTEFHLSRFTPIRTCYITQDISKHLLPGLTVRQSLIYAARLKNINQTIGCDVEKIVSELMRELDLIDTAETLVQNCSGGQRKRIALALELTSLKLPNLICIDEPTSGLDSSSALFVAKYLKRLVRYHPYITIVASIHQPSTELLMIFDHCYLLARDGILIYSGRPDSMRFYLEECLEKNDLQCIPVEMLIKYSCYGGNNRKVQQMSRIINEREKNLEQEIQTDLVQILDGIPLNRNRFNLISITILFERYLNYFLHNRWIEWAIFYTIYISLGLIFRSFFNPSIAEPNGCLSFDDDLIGACFDLSDSKLLEESQIHNSTSYVVSASFFFCFIVSIQTMFTFNYEMEFFANEHRNGWYGCGAFYAVKILFEILPIFPIVFIFIYIIDIYSSIVSNNFFLWNSIILLLAVISCHAISHIVAILTDGRLIIMVVTLITFFCLFFLLSNCYNNVSEMGLILSSLSKFSILLPLNQGILWLIYGGDRCKPDEIQTILMKLDIPNSVEFFWQNLLWLILLALFYHTVALIILIAKKTTRDNRRKRCERVRKYGEDILLWNSNSKTAI